MRLLPPCVLGGLLAAAPAQTYVVDVNNGPGTQFTSIATAVAAVPDGAILDVRAGTYGEFTIQAKGLTILGSGVTVTSSTGAGAITISGTGPTQPVTIRGLAVGGSGPSLAALSCSGPICVERLAGQTWTSPSSSGYWPDVFLLNCAQILLRDVTSGGGFLQAISSAVVMERCSFSGPDMGASPPAMVFYPAPAVAVLGGSLTATDCTLTGGDGGFSWWALPNTVPDSPAIEMMSPADVRVQGASQLRSGASPLSGTGFAAVGGTGSLRLDPAVVLIPSGPNPISAGIATVLGPLPDVVGWSAPPSGTLRADARGPVGQPAILVLGLPGPPYSVPRIADPFWITPQAFVFAAVGAPQPGAPLTASVALPNQAWVRGIVLAWQSVTAGAGGLVASNPTWTLVF